jgi:membrane protein
MMPSMNVPRSAPDRATPPVAGRAGTPSWRDTLRTLRDRFREDRLAVTASSLTFTTLVSMVPLVTVMLAVFTAFPIFGQFQDALQRYFLQSFVPETIARPVLQALTAFASKASRLGAAGLAVFFVSALALVLTIDRTLNQLWRVRRPRPLVQRVLLYWAALTLGPLVVGISLTIASRSIAATRGLWSELPVSVGWGLAVVEFALVFAGLAALYRYVPNTHVRWRHALTGAALAAAGLVVAKRALAAYLGAVPGYSLVYGAFATVPILLVWVYLAWLVVLLGAMVAAYAPSLQSGRIRRAAVPGLAFDIALQVLRELDKALRDGRRGLTAQAIADALRLDPVQVGPVVEELTALDWVGRLDEPGDARHVLLCDPAITTAAPLVQALLLAPGPAGDRLAVRARVAEWTLAELMR